MTEKDILIPTFKEGITPLIWESHKINLLTHNGGSEFSKNMLNSIVIKISQGAKMKLVSKIRKTSSKICKTSPPLHLLFSFLALFSAAAPRTSFLLRGTFWSIFSGAQSFLVEWGRLANPRSSPGFYVAAPT